MNNGNASAAPQIQASLYGSWKSPLRAADVFEAMTEVKNIQFEGGNLYWTEQRADGRTVIVQRSPDGTLRDLTPEEMSVGTRVHEYGGGDFTVSNGELFFSNFQDQCWYRQASAGLEKVTGSTGMRYADGIVDRSRGRLVAVREDHSQSDLHPVNSLVSIKLDHPEQERVLVSGSDFYSNPRLSPDGERLAWMAWNHPNMPWDGTELWVGGILPDGSIGQRRIAAGGAGESIFQPEWADDGSLYFVSDRSGWWNLYRWREGLVEALLPMQAEFGEPQWVFGQRTYAFATNDRLVCTYLQKGIYHLGVLDTRSLNFLPVDVPYSTLSCITAEGKRVFVLAGSATALPVIAGIDLDTHQSQILYETGKANLDPASISVGEAFEFPTERGLTAYGFYYLPRNASFTGPDGEQPPLLVMGHSGPTGASTNAYRNRIQYWTTRGIAVLDVNYGGSTGYGREFRDRLKGNWGVVDVADCVNGTRFLVEQGLADGNRLAITGRSAAGYTTLCALTFYDLFKAGTSYYGICDLEMLAAETHKFESRYNDQLIGPYPEQREVYIQRSPIHHVDRLSRPILLLQGLDDPVVPPSQAEKMYSAVRSRGLPVAYLAFAGERHGFSKAETRIRALEAELYFYGKIFNFQPADVLPPVHIDNLSFWKADPEMDSA